MFFPGGLLLPDLEPMVTPASPFTGRWGEHEPTVEYYHLQAGGVNALPTLLPVFDLLVPILMTYGATYI